MDMRLFRGLILLALASPVFAGESPCSGVAHHQFDFWVGEWEVYLADGRRAGENRISVRDGGCLLLEEWKGAAGSTGTSMNFYDPLTEQWVQVWVGSGSLIRIRGGIVAGSMTLVGELIELGGLRNASPFRGTWTPLDDGRVRQFFEQSEDGGKTWQPWFEGFYVRKEVRKAPES
ncbi:MAG: hypothetical protein P8Y95_00070 [Gammaproteobacteria bacterium]